MNNVSITKEEFEALLNNGEINPETSYFITDTQDVFLGPDLICNLKKEIVERATELSKKSLDAAMEAAMEVMKDKINAEYKDKYLFLMAEFENFKKRTKAEKDMTVKTANEKIIKSLIAVIDDFERGISYITDDSRDGIMLIYDKFIKLLSDYGVDSIIPQEGEPFDEAYHEAVAVITAERDEDKGMIKECSQTGYTLNGKVVRFAKVIVFN